MLGSPQSGVTTGCTGNRSVNPVWTWERANRTLALSTAGSGRCPPRREGRPDRIGPLFDDACPDCRNAGYRDDRTLTCTGNRSVNPV